MKKGKKKKKTTTITDHILTKKGLLVLTVCAWLIPSPLSK